MVLLAVGDVCGEPGLLFFEGHVRPLRKIYGVDVCVVNGENTDITGILPAHAERLYSAGADVVTLGNHAFKRHQISKSLDGCPWLLRPHNYSGELPGTGLCTLALNSSRRLGIVNLVGRCSCEWNCDNPFRVLDSLLAQTDCDLWVVDFHAEVTSEKLAMAYHADGRVSVLFGTHTHVQTSDERVMPKGMGYITDLGMTGPIESVLGIKPEQSIALFLNGTRSRYESQPGPCKLEGILADIDETTGKCVKIERIRIT